MAKKRVSKVLVGIGATPLVLVLLVFGSFQLRQSMNNPAPICMVTNESLASARNSYAGGDHPLDPEVGDEYVGYSGCNVGETYCNRRIEVFGSRLECFAATGLPRTS